MRISIMVEIHNQVPCECMVTSLHHNNIQVLRSNTDIQTIYITSVWTEIDEYWVVYAHPPTLAGWQKARAPQCKCMETRIWWLRVKTGGRSEAVLSWEGSNNVALHFSCSTTSLVLLFFDTQSSNSGLHTFALRCPYLFANQWVWSDRHNYSIFIYFCSHRSCVYEPNILFSVWYASHTSTQTIWTWKYYTMTDEKPLVLCHTLTHVLGLTLSISLYSAIVHTYM